MRAERLGIRTHEVHGEQDVNRLEVAPGDPAGPQETLQALGDPTRRQAELVDREILSRCENLMPMRRMVEKPCRPVRQHERYVHISSPHSPFSFPIPRSSRSAIDNPVDGSSRRGRRRTRREGVQGSKRGHEPREGVQASEGGTGPHKRHKPRKGVQNSEIMLDIVIIPCSAPLLESTRMTGGPG